jgi:hypothetical protein
VQRLRRYALEQTRGTLPGGFSKKKKTTDIVILPTQTASTNQIPKLLSASSVPEEGYNLYLLEPYVYKRINF